jgi:hypothetical protein
MPRPYSLDLRERVIRRSGAARMTVLDKPAFAKLKALLRAKAIRTIDALWRAIGQICDLFSPQECQNYFAAAGYGFI